MIAHRREMALRDSGARLAFVAVLLLGTSPFAEAQEARRMYQLGYLSLPPIDSRLDRFREGLRDLGYVEGRNVVLEIRSAEGKADRLPELAAELVRRKVDLIVAATGQTAVAARKATQTIPIVMLASGDAMRQGLVASLARPGGNVTGLTTISPEVSRKRLELLREMLPKLSHVGGLRCVPPSAVSEQEWAEARAAADILGVRLSWFDTRGREDLPGAFASASKQGVEAVLGFDCPSLVPSAGLIAELSRQHRLPGMYTFAPYPRAGNLMSYGADLADMPRRAATYVDKILRGVNPADLPVEQPTRFTLVINAKTAKTLGLTIPPSLLLRADQVIE